MATMHLVHIASEFYPFAKTGGLADAVGALAGRLAARGHQVTVFMPGYRSALEHPLAAGAELRLRLKVEMGERYFSGELRRLSLAPGLDLIFVCRDESFDRRGLYGNGERDFEDNFYRFLFFQKAVVDALRLMEIRADAVNCHDWQTGLLPLLLRDAERRLGHSLAATTVFTIHNIAFQGLFPMKSFHRTNLPAEFMGIDGVEFYGQISMLKAGILFADRVTTVSPSYAREIQTPAFGCGMEGVIASRADSLTGILNGIDREVWDPSKDKQLPARYSAADMSGKAICREALLKALGLKPAPGVPVFGMVCRLTEQKGVDLVLANRDFFIKEPVRLAVLGTGDRRLEQALRELAAHSPGKVAIAPRHDEGMSHLIEAGSDFFLMPSRFEPCGLNQLYSQAYGTPPLVGRVGGLKDTVIDADEDPEHGTGLSFTPDSKSLGAALRRAMRLWSDLPRYAAVQKRGMEADFSWDAPVRAYERLYSGY